jgi:hypothetical protein
MNKKQLVKPAVSFDFSYRLRLNPVMSTLIPTAISISGHK